jgi:predicted nucleic acid-binding protein
MVLVDTSIWIRFLSNREPYASALSRLLQQNEVGGHVLVYGELLIGDNGGRQQLLTDYALMHHTPPVPHQEIVAFVRYRRLYGRGLSWIDVHLLASALVAGAPLWSADLRLADVARELDIAYQ